MKALIDGDLLAYECSACGQVKDPETGVLIIKNFDTVAEMLDQRVKEIVEEAFCDEDPTLYLTGDEKLLAHINKQRMRDGDGVKVYRPNFRKEVAVTKPYKGNRKSEKPFHFDNIRAYMLGAYYCVVTDGMEADDKLCIDQYADILEHGYGEMNVTLCSRDKDLRMNPGLHYRWACGKQLAEGPIFIDELGSLRLSDGATKRLKGEGIKFFYSQVITGDIADNIPGLPKHGPVFAFNILDGCGSERECFEAVRNAYERVYGDLWETHMREMVDLVWMIREVNEDGTLKFYQWPEEKDDKDNG